MPKGVPLTEVQIQQQRRMIYKAAIQLFQQKGFYETSMREIATAAKVGKSTLYDYFKSKDEILVSYFITEILDLKKRAEEICLQELSSTEKIQRIMKMHLAYLLSQKQTFLRLSLEAQRLPLESQDQIQAVRHSYQDMIRALVEEGVGRGEFRPVNPLITARSIMALLSIVTYTARPTGTPEEMLDQVMSILFTGIQA
jgi:AcrR family transcriptional regulator